MTHLVTVWTGADVDKHEIADNRRLPFMKLSVIYYSSSIACLPAAQTWIVMDCLGSNCVKMFQTGSLIKTLYNSVS